MKRRLVVALRWLVWLKVCALVGALVAAAFGKPWAWGAVGGSLGYVLGELQRARIGAKLF